MMSYTNFVSVQWKMLAHNIFQLFFGFGKTCFKFPIKNDIKTKTKKRIV